MQNHVEDRSVMTIQTSTANPSWEKNDWLNGSSFWKIKLHDHQKSWMQQNHAKRNVGIVFFEMFQWFNA